jgi:hypothetical protein
MVQSAKIGFNNRRAADADEDAKVCSENYMLLGSARCKLSVRDVLDEKKLWIVGELAKLVNIEISE